ncbi:hypothetical protein BY996DRAFT_6516350 [Phakopsora pachyrhizi]|uniref:Uncharacterized protein n=1 Tax=Phakopsora pachyrhizi TaxID=170000 RepID=A0AAV0BLA8_PHAPC|nr:hypothetical protein BY996DRAFT_6516350 [Phakopsora pachyrhizi]CAH7687124.1 hypothetical protein PPACK8108_LOCUS21864 [Phakopsora pachyrhizi]
MVRAQLKLLDHLGISKLFVSVGSSMGGMQSIVTACGCGITGPSSIALQYAQWSGQSIVVHPYHSSIPILQ